MNQNNKGSLFTSLCLLGILVQNCYGCYNKITNNVEELGLFAKCQNKWCLQKGLQKPQYTKCESVENKGNTCINPEIKYGTTIGGLPIKCSLNNYEKWCEQLGGFYADHCIGKRTGYMVLGCTGYDDPENWHWCDVGDFYWYSQSLDYHVDNVADAETYDYFITSITCTGEYSFFA